MNKSEYYYWASYHRKMLDLLLEEYKYLYKGVVLDIGGRERGKFVKPRENIKKWIFADINKEHNPDIILDVANMKQIDSESIDVINALELFEHVQEIELGLNECYRVLKKKSVLIISIPFLFQIHADPFDFQRWTDTKWRMELKKVGFKIEKMIVMGRFFSHMAGNFKDFLMAIKKSYSHIGSILLKVLHPFLDRIIKFDNKSFVKNDKTLSSYHNGYFIIARK